jgi:hypothetical protein
MIQDIRMDLPDMVEQSQGNLLTKIFHALDLDPSGFKKADDAEQALLQRIRELRAHEERLRIETGDNVTAKHEPDEISSHS